MKWQHRWGPREDFLAGSTLKTGIIPPALLNRPTLEDGDEEYVTAFMMLNTRRSSGMGPNPISLTEILAYVQLYEVNEPETFVRVMVEMDVVLMGELADDHKRSSSKLTNKR